MAFLGWLEVLAGVPNYAQPSLMAINYDRRAIGRLAGVYARSVGFMREVVTVPSS